MSKVITVTREHWERGVKDAFSIREEQLKAPEHGYVFDGDLYCQKCVLAQAMTDAGFKKVSVGKGTAKLDGVHYRLPKAAKEIIDSFDAFETQQRTGRKQEGFVEPAFPIAFEIEEM